MWLYGICFVHLYVDCSASCQVMCGIFLCGILVTLKNKHSGFVAFQGLVFGLGMQAVIRMSAFQDGHENNTDYVFKCLLLLIVNYTFLKRGLILTVVT